METISEETLPDRTNGDEEVETDDMILPAEKQEPDARQLEEEHDIAIQGLYGNMDHMGG